jgi:outer membrane assembly lipoprotein YfiO
MLRAWARFLPVLAVCGLVACGAARPPAELDAQGRFEWSVQQFEAGRYSAAINGFVDFILRDPLNPRVDSAQYLLGESYLRSGQELRAAQEFQQLATTRPNSPLADDAQLGTCRAYWRLSPSIPREQENTRRAVQECSRLLELFPRSPLRDEARQILSEAQAKLATKAYRVGRFYFDRGLYESANIYFEMALDEGPNAPVVPEVLARLYESYRRVGFESEAEAVRQRLLREHADTEQARQLRREPATANG